MYQKPLLKLLPIYQFNYINLKQIYAILKMTILYKIISLFIYNSKSLYSSIISSFIHHLELRFSYYYVELGKVSSVRIIIQLANQIYFIFEMNFGSGDYYSVSSKGYSRQANVEVIGIDPRTINHPRNTPEPPTVSAEKQVETQSVIKEEEMEYDLQESRNSHQEQDPVKLKIYDEARQIMQKSEVNSVHISGKFNQQTLTHSCIGNNYTPYKGILKRSLQEIQKKKIKSNEDSCDDKQLYIELEKERKLRRDLEKSYKNLLSQLHRNQRYYSVDLNPDELQDRNKKRQFSKSTLRGDKNNDQGISQDDLMMHKKNIKSSDIKTVKQNKLRVREQMESQRSKQELLRTEEAEQQQDIEEQPIIYPQNMDTQQSLEEEQDYFQQQREYQTSVLMSLESLNKKIEDIDQYLMAKQQQREKDRMRQLIQDKQKQIRKVQLQNEQLRKQSETVKQFKLVRENNQVDFLSNLTPNSLYFLCICLMVIVAIA